MTKSTNPKKAQNAKQRKEAKSLLWTQARQEVRPLAIGGIAMIISSYSNQAVPRLMGSLIDPMSSSKSTTLSSSKNNNAHLSLANSLAMNILWVGLIGGTASFLRTCMLNRAQENVAARLRKNAFSTLLMGHDLEWFQSVYSNEESESAKKEGDETLETTTTKEDTTNTEKIREDEKIENDETNASTTNVSALPGITPATIGMILNDDVELVANTATKTVSGLLRSLSSCTFATVNMLLLNPNLVGLSLVVAPVVGSVALLTRKYLKKIQTIQRDAEAVAASFVEERLNHMAMVKMSNRELDEVAKYSEMQDELVQLGRKSAFADGLSMGSMFFLSTSALCGILYSGGKAIQAKRMSHGELVSFGSYSFLLALGSAGIIRAMGEFSKGVAAAARLNTLLLPSESPSGANGKKVASTESLSGTQLESSAKQASAVKDSTNIQQLQIENLHFSYKSDPSKAALHDVSFQLSRGEIVVVTGKNGAGKSTLSMLLAGLYKPVSGKILIQAEGAQPMDYMKEFGREEQARIVQVVPQSPVLFNASIADNVKYTRPTATPEQVQKAVTIANCDEFVSKLEGGVDYIVGRNGFRLSGGQRQRIGLARALLADPIFLVLDEPASSMDAHGENAVADAIKACRDSDRSLLVISHRMKTLQMADRLIVLKDGAVAEQGTFDELQAKQGELYSLMPDLK